MYELTGNEPIHPIKGKDEKYIGISTLASYPGLTLMQYLTAQAMQAIVTTMGPEGTLGHEHFVARQAISLAGALISELNKNEE